MVDDMKKIILLLILLAVALPLHAENAARIAAVVNNQLITSTELNDRLALTRGAGGMPDNAETRQKLAPQILRSLIEEQLRMQEAVKQKIVIDDNEVKAGFAQIAQQNNMTPEQFQAELHQAGVNDKTLMDQVRTQIAWAKLIRERLSPKVQIQPADVEAYIARLKNDIGKPQYLLAEIVLPVDNAAEENQIMQLAGRIIADMKKGARFSAIARQVSQSATARNGGDLGWINSGDLAKELDEVLPKLPVGQITDPIRTSRGYVILLLREKRNLSEENLPKREEVTNIIGNQKLDILQRRLLRDLRNDAVIDVRM